MDILEQKYLLNVTGSYLKLMSIQPGTREYTRKTGRRKERKNIQSDNRQQYNNGETKRGDILCLFTRRLQITVLYFPNPSSLFSACLFHEPRLQRNPGNCTDRRQKVMAANNIFIIILTMEAQLCPSAVFKGTRQTAFERKTACKLKLYNCVYRAT